MKIVTIHQPEHLSYLGFFHKVSLADTLVVLDNVAFEKNYFQNRNRINTNKGEEFITIPVSVGSSDCLIKDVKIADEFMRSVMRKNIETILLAYKKCRYFELYFEEFVNIYSSNFSTLSELNLALMRFIFYKLGISTKIVLASSLNVSGSKTDLLVNILDVVGADKYISGCSGKDYLEMEKFRIPVEFQNFKHPVYTQYGKNTFTPYLSIIDALFNVGGEITNIINHANGKGKGKGN